MLVFTIAVFAIFIWDRFAIASVCLGILVGLSLFFLAFPIPVDGEDMSPARFFRGFGHPALVAISSLMILGQGLVVTGALEPVARKLSGLVGSHPMLSLFAVLAGAMLVSGIVNDTPVVVLLIPLLLAATQRAKTSPTGLLMPMNFAVLIGGMSTTIGTSTNLIVTSMAVGLGLPRIGLLDFYPMVMAAALPALFYLWLVAPRLLRSVPSPMAVETKDAFDSEIVVEADSWLDGRELREAISATEGRMRVMAVRDDKLRVRTRLPTLKLRAGDRIIIQDTVANLKEFESALKAPLHGMGEDKARSVTSEEPKTEEKRADPTNSKPAVAAKGDKSEASSKSDDDDKPVADAVVAQLIVTPDSPLVGRSIRALRLADTYRLVMVGLRPARDARAWIRSEIADRQIGAGDVLLVQGLPEQVQAAQHDGIGLLLDARYTLPRQSRAWIALATMAAVVLAAVFKLLPIEVAALAGVGVLLATRTLSWGEAGSSLSIKVVMLVAASLALGDALTVTGTTQWLAEGLVHLSDGLQPRWMLVLLMGLMGLVTNFVSNNAAAAIGTPLAMALAQQLGAPPLPFVLAVLFGCNLCYITPMGYQTNLLVMNAAGYRFGDFVRVGTPLFVLMWACLSALVIWRYGL